MTFISNHWPFFNKTKYDTKFYAESYDLLRVFIPNFRAVINWVFFFIIKIHLLYPSQIFAINSKYEYDKMLKGT